MSRTIHGYQFSIDTALDKAVQEGRDWYVITTSMGFAEASRTPLVGPACDLPSTIVHPDGTVEYNAYFHRVGEEYVRCPKGFDWVRDVEQRI